MAKGGGLADGLEDVGAEASLPGWRAAILPQAILPQCTLRPAQKCMELINLKQCSNLSVIST